MPRQKWMPVVCPLLFVPLLLFACGESTSEEYTCCYNGAFYDCPSSEELDKCGQGEDHDCERMPEHDDECE